MVVGDSSQQLATLLQHRLVPLRLLPSLSSLLEDGASFCEKGCLAVVEDAHLALEQLALLLQPERRADEEVVRQGFIPAHVNDGLLVVHALLGNEDVVQGGALALTAPLVRDRVSLVGHPQEIDLPLMEPGGDIGGRLVEVSHEDNRRLIAALAELGEDAVLDS